MTIDRSDNVRGGAVFASASLIAALFLNPTPARGRLAATGTPETSVAAATRTPPSADEAPPPSMQPEPPALDDSIEGAEAEEPNPPPARRFVNWNQYEGPYFTFRFGAHAMYDVGAYQQDKESQQQVGAVEDSGKWRDFRLIASGRFPKIKREVLWKAGYMYDGINGKWLWRETGFIIAVPEIWGHVFIGRTKEGFSLMKHMSGAAMWGLERTEMLDATIPIMADGIRWMGYLPKQRLVWNFGVFNETIWNRPLYPFYDQEYVLRTAWLPYLSEKGGTLLHVGLNLRYGNPTDGKTQLKSKPESTTAPNFIDTGVFKADHTEMIGPELYYRNGPLLLGGEYYFMKTRSEAGDHSFHGGNVDVTWTITGEARGYKTRGGTFDFLYPRQSVFEGGWGAWEASLNFSYIDADSGNIRGGRFWRVSPNLAWYLAYNLRWTIGYGYGVLDRFDKKGSTQFYQSRLHFMF